VAGVNSLASASTTLSLLGLDPASYQRHPLHDPARVFPETNCYTDVWIELLHARGLEPLAALGTTVAVDFEGDQWTFFKPDARDLATLYGIDVHEMQPYRPLPLQCAQQLAQGRTLCLEVDSWYLPDTHATSYRQAHVKSSIALEAVDTATQRLRYFHGGGLHELGGDDYRGVLRCAEDLPADSLDPYVELVRFDAGTPLRGAELNDAALTLLGGHLSNRSRGNPFLAFGAQLERELPRLVDGDLDAYHAYAFATARMAGSAFEVAASHVQWLLGERADSAVAALGEIVESAKALSFRLARRRLFDPTPLIERLAAAWEESMTRLDTLTG
jgi:hypothetical protein